MIKQQDFSSPCNINNYDGIENGRSWPGSFFNSQSPPLLVIPGADLGGGCRGYAPPPPRDKAFVYVSTYSLLIFFTSPSVTSFLRGAPPPKKNPGSAPAYFLFCLRIHYSCFSSSVHVHYICFTFRFSQLEEILLSVETKPNKQKRLKYITTMS